MDNIISLRGAHEIIGLYFLLLDNNISLRGTYEIRFFGLPLGGIGSCVAECPVQKHGSPVREWQPSHHGLTVEPDDSSNTHYSALFTTNPNIKFFPEL